MVLKATGIQYGSTHDEDAFFEWLAKIPAVTQFHGRVRTLYIHLDPAVVDDEVLRDLIALFHRYDVDLRQLRCFDTPDVGDWFRNPESYWHEAMWGPSSDELHGVPAHVAQGAVR